MPLKQDHRPDGAQDGSLSPEEQDAFDSIAKHYEQQFGGEHDVLGDLSEAEREAFNDLAGNYDNDEAAPEGESGSADREQGNDNEDSSSLRHAEANPESAAPQAESDADGGGLYSDDESEGDGRFSKIRGQFTRNRVAAGVAGAIVTTVLGISAVASGPLQLVHIAQLLSRFHFGISEDIGDDRFSKIARYIRYKDTPERTRLGYLGNKFADRIEAKMNANGIRSAYTDRYGYFNGYVVVPDDLPGDSPLRNIANLPEDEMKIKFAERYNISPENISLQADGTIHLAAEDMGYFKSNKFISAALEDSGFSKVSTAVRTRILRSRAGIDLHPIKKLDRKLLEAADKRIAKWRENRQKSIDQGETTLKVTAEEGDTDGNGNTAPDSSPDADAVVGEADDIAKDAAAAGKEISSGTPLGAGEASSALRGRIGGIAKVGGTATATVGLVCLVKGIADTVDDQRLQKIVLPLERMGMESIALGGQVMSSAYMGLKGDIDLEQMGYYARLLYSDEDGSWSAAKSIQSELNEPLTGPDISSEAKIKKEDNFVSHFIGRIPAIGSICKAANSGVGQVVSFGFDIISGPASAVVGQATGMLAGPLVIEKLTAWLSGHPININVKGANYGNFINYGAKLAANDSLIAGGGTKLSKKEFGELKRYDQQRFQDELMSKSVADRLFNPTQSYSLVSRIIDKQDPNGLSNTLRATASITNIFSGLTRSVGSLFSAKAYAQETYDYGFDDYGFSADFLNDPRMENPFENANLAAAALQGPKGQTYVKRAEQCFNIKIDPAKLGATGGITSKESKDYKDIKDEYGCNSDELDWKRVRMLILDTQTMQAAACVEGDGESCDASGFGGSSAQTSSSDTTKGGGIVSGDAKTLAAEILKQEAAGKINFTMADARQSIVDTAEGREAVIEPRCTNAGRSSAPMSATLLGLILTVAKTHTLGIGYTTNGCHSPNSAHYSGRGLDINNVDGRGSDGGAADRPFMQELVNLMPDGSGIGQAQCNGPALNITKDIAWFEDSCDHIHINVPN